MATMLLAEKFKKGLIREGTYIPNFQPDFAECILEPEETGWKEKQVFHTEIGMKYQIVRFGESQLALLSDTCTKQEICLRGKKGATKGVQALQKLHETSWSSKKFHSQGLCVNVEQFRKLPTVIREKCKGTYYLGSPYVRPNTSGASFGVCYVFYGHMDYYELYHSYGCPNSYYDCVRPAVLLPSDIMIDDNNNLVPFDKTKRRTCYRNSPSGLVSIGEKNEIVKALETMIADEESRLEEQQKQISEYFAEQNRRLEEMKTLISKLL